MPTGAARSAASVLRRIVHDDGSAVLERGPKDVETASLRERLRHEAAILADLRHDNIIRPLAPSEGDGATGARLRFEDVDGVGLAELLRTRGRLDVHQSVGIGRDLAQALAAAHRAEVIHRGVRPDAVFVTHALDRAVLTDFGDATRVPRQQAAPAGPIGETGALPYVAPEQTGRMSRPVDSRCDLYALGCVLHELVVGTPPFAMTDPLELVHSHLAVTPVRIDEHVAAVPPAFADVVERLLEKDPDDRYRSAAGVVTDLDLIARGLEEPGLLEGFRPGTSDLSSVFLLPERLYGRDEELARLTALLDRGRHEARVGFVHGPAGAGKSALLGELQDAVTKRRGMLVTGRFEQLSRGVPYQAVVTALRQMMRRVLTQDDAKLADVRAGILDQLGTTAQVLTGVIPELADVLGPQPAAPELSRDAERVRFTLALTGVVKAVTNADDAPVVMVLDDLQWGDAATLEFIGRIAAEQIPIILIGSYRDVEIEVGHPLLRTQKDLAELGVQIVDIALPALSRSAVAALVRDTLMPTVDDVEALIDVCIRKTGANPFFLRLFLRTLYTEGLVRPTPDGWAWQLGAIRSRAVTENVADLAVERLDQVAQAGRDLVPLLAVTGSGGDAEGLVRVDDRLGGTRDVEEGLTQLASVGLVEITTAANGLGWRFAHDKIEEAAYQLVDKSQRDQLHRAVGEDLVEQGASGFDVLAQLNRVPLEDGEGIRLATMNRDAGREAMGATAYDAAYDFFTTGIGQLGASLWDDHADLAVALHLGAANAARLATQSEAMERWLTALDLRARHRYDRVEIALIRILHRSQAGQNPEAVVLARERLAEFGVELPESPSLAPVLRGMVETRLKLRSTSIEELATAPEMTDPDDLAVCRLLSETMSAAYFADPNTMALMVQEGVKRSVASGVATSSPLYFTAFGLVLAGIVGKPAQGLAYADLGVQLADRFGAPGEPARARFTRDSLTAPFVVPLERIIPDQEYAYRIGLETGDVGYGTGSLYFRVMHRLLTSTPLDVVADEAHQSVQVIRRLAQLRNLAAAVTMKQFVADLRGEDDGDSGEPFSGPHADASTLDDSLASGDLMSAGWVALLRGIARWHLGDRSAAAADLALANASKDAMLGQALVPMLHLYAIVAESWDELGSGRRFSVGALRHRRRLRWFAKHEPTANETRCLIADGALAGMAGRWRVASDHFHKASTMAEARGQTWERALATELLAEVEGRAGRGDLRDHWLDVATDAYDDWGAHAVARRLRRKTTTRSTTEDLDVLTVVRMSEAIVGEIELDSLLEALMSVVLHNAGAERGLLLRVGDTPWVEAAGRMDGPNAVVETWLTTAPPAAVVAHAESVVRYVTRTRETVLCRDIAVDERFADDAYVSANVVRSVLCLPLVHQSQVQGLLYLENNKVVGAFTPQRVELLRMVSAQAAIALEKARLFEAQRSLVASQARFVPAQFLESLGRRDITEVSLGESTSKLMDVMFSDIRGFTRMAEAMTPPQTLAFLNDYLSSMEPEIIGNNGFVDHFLGDGILALFDVGTGGAVRAGVAMARAEREANTRRVAAGAPPVRTGIGVNTGNVVLGIVGGSDQIRATVIGDPANLASRVENLTKRYRTTLVITDHTREALPPGDEHLLRPLEWVQVMGRTAPVLMHEVIDALPPDVQERRRASMDTYLEAFRCFVATDFIQAAEGFGVIIASDPDDHVATVLRDHAVALQGTDVGDDWQPIVEMEHK